jgi:hypothetical protein
MSVMIDKRTWKQFMKRTNARTNSMQQIQIQNKQHEEKIQWKCCEIRNRIRNTITTLSRTCRMHTRIEWTKCQVWQIETHVFHDPTLANAPSRYHEWIQHTELLFDSNWRNALHFYLICLIAFDHWTNEHMLPDPRFLSQPELDPTHTRIESIRIMLTNKNRKQKCRNTSTNNTLSCTTEQPLYV